MNTQMNKPTSSQQYHRTTPQRTPIWKIYNPMRTLPLHKQLLIPTPLLMCPIGMSHSQLKLKRRVCNLLTRRVLSSQPPTRNQKVKRNRLNLPSRRALRLPKDKILNKLRSIRPKVRRCLKMKTKLILNKSGGLLKIMGLETRI